MTWLGDQTPKVSNAKETKLKEKRAKLVEELKALKTKGPAGRFDHNKRQHQEDLLAICHEIEKCNRKMGIPSGSFE
jgi:hypothetical protein